MSWAVGIDMVLSRTAAWIPFAQGTTIGQIGSEGGTILREEAHTDGARIALERVQRKRLFRAPAVHFAITCGLYGWMVHTRFFETLDAATDAYQAMKAALEELIAALPLENDPGVDEKMNAIPPLLSEFIERYP